jgi:hypothetical protein
LRAQNSQNEKRQSIFAMKTRCACEGHISFRSRSRLPTSFFDPTSSRGCRISMDDDRAPCRLPTIAQVLASGLWTSWAMGLGVESGKRLPVPTITSAIPRSPCRSELKFLDPIPRKAVAPHLSWPQARDKPFRECGIFLCWSQRAGKLPYGTCVRLPGSFFAC